MSAVRVSQPAPRVSRPPGGPVARVVPGDPGHDAGQRPRSPLVWPPLEFRRSGREAPHMRITAAVLYDVNKPYSIETVELDPPKRGEVLVKIRAAGVCRSDLHFQKGEAIIALPAVLGHEGSGVVESVGEGVTMV